MERGQLRSRTARACTLLAALLTLASAAPDDVRVEGQADLTHMPAEFGGISAIEHDPRTRTWLLLSDDRSEHAPARFYRLRLAQRKEGLAVQSVRAVTLRDRHGRPFPRPGAGEAVDPEAIRVTDDGSALLWASEGDARSGGGPLLRRMGRDGRERRRIDLPVNLGHDPAGRSGPRDNLSLEGLAVAPGGALWLSMEAPLIQDGEVAGLSRPALVRFTRLRSGAPARQYAYRVDAIPHTPEGRLADNGVSEILALDDHRLLVLERSGTQRKDGGFDFHCRLYLADLSQAGDVAALPSLDGTAIRVAEKRLLVDFDRLAPQAGNLEGMAWWPSSPRGRRSLVFVNDNGFEAGEPTRLLLLSLPAAALR